MPNVGGMTLVSDTRPDEADMATSRYQVVVAISSYDLGTECS